MSELSAPPSAPSSIPPNSSGSPIPTPPEPVIDLAALRASEQGKALVAWVKNRYKACESAREREKRRWYMNLALYNGDHYSEFTRAGQPGYLHAPIQARGKERQTINRIRPIIRTEMARLLSQKPSASVIPASSDDEDLFIAAAAEQVWQSIADRRKVRKEFAEAAFWTVITGTGFMKTYWDANLRDETAKMAGDIKYEAVSPFNLFVPDLREQEIEDQPYIINVYTRSIDWLKYFFRDQLEGVALQPSVVSQNSLMEEAYVGLRGSGEAAPDSCLVYEMWIKPGGSPHLPNGGLITLVDDVIVGYSDNGIPYTHGEYPFTKFEHIPTARFYGDSVIVDVEGLQRDYNSLRSQIAETRKKMAKVQLVAPKGTISAARITNEIGLVIEFKPGFGPPQPIPLAQLPAYVLQEQDRILVDMEDITGQHQVSKGNVPPGVTAATAISYLQEKDDSYLVHTYQSIEQGWEKIARQTLNLVVQYWDVRRMVKTAGEDNTFDTMLLAGSDLVNGTDIRIEPGSALPQSKAARQAYIMDLMTQGFVPPEKGLELLEIGGAQKILDSLQIDKRQAQRENIKMKSLTEEMFTQYDEAWQQAMGQAEMLGDVETVDEMGQPLEQPPIVTVNTWDNHEVHIEVHNQFRRSQAFERCSPRVKEAFEQHVKMHKQAMMFDMMDPAMMAPEEMTGGSPPPIDHGHQEEEAPPPGEEMPPPMQEGGLE